MIECWNDGLRKNPELFFGVLQPHIRSFVVFRQAGNVLKFHDCMEEEGSCQEKSYL